MINKTAREVPFTSLDAGFAVFRDTVQKLDAAHGLVFAIHYLMPPALMDDWPPEVKEAYQRCRETFRPNPTES